MAAKFTVDADDQSIVAYEVRFSSGFPLAMAALLWTAYGLFSATMPADAPILPALFIAIAALMALIGGLVNLRILRSRMEKLLQDGLSEFKQTRP
jgi:hypothetical protein